ncbi:MAG: hypothetical protein IPF78_04495 [Flavobacteriales bacterium]|nr:hypothetical protein [Flavobacteriales bacterium]
MRLSFLSAFPPYRGGIAQFSTSLVLELRKEHDVLAFTFTCQYPDLLFPAHHSTIRIVRTASGLSGC